MYITRDKAIEAIYRVVNSGILEDELEEDLVDVANNIQLEKVGIHAWGADDELSQMFVAHRSDLITDEIVERDMKLQEEYSFIPCPHERSEFEYIDDEFEFEDEE